MKITGLQIDNFGVWSGLSIDSFPDGTVVFFGPNEAGKSTLLQFLRTMLYGFTDEHSRRFVQNLNSDTAVLSLGGRVGGSLTLVTRDQQYHVRRHASLTEPWDAAGEVRVTSRDESRHGANRLTTLLAGIDETIFNNVFAVSLREMQQLGTLNDTQAARFLYNLSTGTDRVSLVDVMRQLQTTRARLIGGDDQDAYLRRLLDRRAACHDRVQKLSIQGDLWAQLKSELDRLIDEVKRLESSRENWQRRTREAELVLRVQPMCERERQLKIEIEALGEVKQIPDDVFQRLAAIDQESATNQGRCDEQDQQILQLQRNLQALAGASSATRQLARIEALVDQQSTIAGLHDEVQRLKAEVEESEFELHAEQERLGISAVGRAIVPRFDSATFSSLREPARNVEHLRSLLEQTKKDAAAAKEEALQVEQYLAETLGKDRDWFDGKDQQDIVHALEQTGEVAAALRQRAQLQGRVRDCDKKLKLMMARRKRLLKCQLLPWEVIKALGALFAVGFMLLIWAFLGDRFGLDERMRAGLGILGGIGVAVATLLKLVLQSASQEDLELCNRDTEAMERDVELAQEELTGLTAKLPSRSAGPVKLHDAETRIVRLESLLPLEGQRRRILDRAAAAEGQAVETATQLKAARHRWEDQLEALGLSRQLTPTQVRELAGDSGNLVHLYQRHESALAEQERVERELQMYRQRMRDVMAEAGIGAKAGTAIDELSHLQLHVSQHQQHRRERDALQEKIRRATRDQQQTQARLHDLQRRRQSILTPAGAVDDEDLRNMKQQRGQYEALRRQINEVTREIRNVLGSDAELIATDLYQQNLADVQQKLAAGIDELERIDQRLKDLLQRRGQVNEQLRALSADDRLGLARLELGMLDAQLAAGVRQWKTISVITALLKKVYKRYEKERQPETLKEASQHLSRMTCGRYQRIWTRLDEDVLIVENKQGESLTVDQLSRGTREQMFLALRLALVSDYARRGIKMPLVLDDVLVNFDEQRTKAAAEVLVDFAQSGHQLLVFTCHQHVMTLFQELDAHVQALPSRSETGGVVTPRFTATEKATADVPHGKTARGKKKRGARRTDRRRQGKAPAFLIGYSGEREDATELAPIQSDMAPARELVLPPPAFTLAGEQEHRPAWSSVDDWEFGHGQALELDLPTRDYVEQLFPAAAFTDDDPMRLPPEPSPAGGERLASVELETELDDSVALSPAMAIDWYPEPDTWAAQLVDELPNTSVLSDRGPAPSTEASGSRDGAIMTRVDSAQRPPSMIGDVLKSDTTPGREPPDPGCGQAMGEEGDDSVWMPVVGPGIISVSALRTPTGDAARWLEGREDELDLDAVIDVPLEDEATDITSADFLKKSESPTNSWLGGAVRKDPATDARGGYPTREGHTLAANEGIAADGDPTSAAPHTPGDFAPEHQPRFVPPVPLEPGRMPDAGDDMEIDSQSIQTESSEVLGSQTVISSTRDTNLPIVNVGSVVQSADREDSVLDEENKEEPMSTVDPFVSEALPHDTPLESADAAPVADVEAEDEAYEYEYVDADEEDDDCEVATATGDVQDDVEYEYEYVDDDEEDEGDDDEYEYVEVEVDEDGNEIEATAVEGAEDVEEDEYEYVDDEEDGDDQEVATASGDLTDDLEYEYEYVDDDEDEDNVDDQLSAKTTTDDDDDDDEYEYEEV